MALMEQAGILATAVDVMFEGAEHGEIEDEPRSPGEKSRRFESGFAVVSLTSCDRVLTSQVHAASDAADCDRNVINQA
jgi:hypothetical protein